MSIHVIELKAPNGDLVRGYHLESFSFSADFINPVLMIFCHGFPGSSMEGHNHLFEHLQNICARIGVSSVRFDFRGSGLSDGAPENFTITTACEDLELIYDWAQKNNFKRLMITAEGLGSVPVLMNLSENIYAATFFWPVFDTHDYARRNLDAEEHKQNFEQGGFIKISGSTVGIPLIKELYEMDLVPLLHSVKMPTLIQQGAKDKIIPVQHLDLARAHFRNRRIELTTYQDGTHGLPQDNHRKFMMFHYEQFVQKYV